MAATIKISDIAISTLDSSFKPESHISPDGAGFAARLKEAISSDKHKISKSTNHIRDTKSYEKNSSVSLNKDSAKADISPQISSIRCEVKQELVKEEILADNEIICLDEMVSEMVNSSAPLDDFSLEFDACDSEEILPDYNIVPVIEEIFTPFVLLDQKIDNKASVSVLRDELEENKAELPEALSAFLYAPDIISGDTTRDPMLFQEADFVAEMGGFLVAGDYSSSDKLLKNSNSIVSENSFSKTSDVDALFEENQPYLTAQATGSNEQDDAEYDDSATDIISTAIIAATTLPIRQVEIKEERISDNIEDFDEGGHLSESRARMQDSNQLRSGPRAVVKVNRQETSVTLKESVVTDGFIQADDLLSGISEAKLTPNHDGQNLEAQELEYSIDSLKDYSTKLSISDIETGKFKLAEVTSAESLSTESPAEQVSLNIRQAISTGKQKMTIALNPENLGKVEIQIDISNGKVKEIKILAHRMETLDAIVKDSLLLEQTVREILKSETNLNFSYRHDDGSNSNFAGTHHSSASSSYDKQYVGVTDASIGTGAHIISDDQVDIRI